MKNVKLLVLLLALLMVLSGCGNKTAKISNSSEVIFKVGKISFTQGDLYETLKKSDTAYTVINDAGALIVNAEVPTTDELAAEAQAKVDEYKEKYGDQFEDAIKYYGYADEQALYDSILTSLKNTTLIENHIKANLEDLYTRFSPKMAKMIYVKVGDDGLDAANTLAEAAIEMINTGSTFEEAAAAYSSDTDLAKEAIYTAEDDIDVNVASFLKTAEASGLSNVIVAKDNKGFYVVSVTGTSRASVEESFISYLKNSDDYTAEIDKYYFTKHNFQIYDVEINDYVKSNFPNYLPASK